MKNLNQVNTFLLVLFSICLIVSIAVYEKKLVALNETIQEVSNLSNEMLLNLDGNYINQIKDLGGYEEYTGSIDYIDGYKYKLKTKYINNAMHIVFSIPNIQWEEDGEMVYDMQLTKIKKFFFVFLDKDRFTLLRTEEVHLKQMDFWRSKIEIIFSTKFDINEDTYLLIDDVIVGWKKWE
jgi:hypothetical protein